MAVLLLFYFLISSEVHGAEGDSKAERIKEILKTRDTEINFYGKIADQNNQPIKEALVKLHISYYDPNRGKDFYQGAKQLLVKSDNDGLFRVEKEFGNTLFINTIEKEDCLFERASHSERLGFIFYDGAVKRHRPNIGEPIVYTMKKQINPTFLISNNEIEWIAKLNDQKAQFGVDFISRVGSSQMVSGGLDNWFFDMVMSVAPRNDKWEVTIEAKGADGGVLGSEVVLNEAPVEGYAKTLTFIAENEKIPVKKYIYIRSREPSIYSSVAIEWVAVNQERIWIQVKSLTNPYGDRNLEEKKGMPGEVSQQLINDAIISFRKNVYPDKSKIVEYLKAYNDARAVKP